MTKNISRKQKCKHNLKNKNKNKTQKKMKGGSKTKAAGKKCIKCINA
jgi:hypothetical protein